MPDASDHTATTTVLVLEGEQHLWDLHPDGTRGEDGTLLMDVTMETLVEDWNANT